MTIRIPDVDKHQFAIKPITLHNNAPLATASTLIGAWGVAERLNRLSRRPYEITDVNKRVIGVCDQYAAT